MPLDPLLIRELWAEDLPAAERQARSLGLALQRGEGDKDTGPNWWPRMNGLGYPRGDAGEVVYCTPGIREYHEHGSHRGEQHRKEIWKLSRVIALAWKYLYASGSYAGRGGV